MIYCNPPFLLSDIRAPWHSVLSTRTSEIKKGGLDQYGAEHFGGRLIFATIRKSEGLKGLKKTSEPTAVVKFAIPCR